MISVIIHVYKEASTTLASCLLALLEQKIKDLEIIIVYDDGAAGSKMKKAQRLEKVNLISDLNIREYEISHGGAPKARNCGASVASGEFLFFCDADHKLYHGSLQASLDILTMNPGIAFVYGDFQVGGHLFRWWDFDVAKLKKQNYLNSSCLLRRSYFVPWDESLTCFQDWDFWLGVVLIKGGAGQYLRQTMFWTQYRRGINATGNHGRSIAAIRKKFDLF